MPNALTFDEILEVVDRLSGSEQSDLIRILNHRRIERGRDRLLNEIEQAEREFAEGQAKVVTPEELMREILA